MSPASEESISRRINLDLDGAPGVTVLRERNTFPTQSSRLLRWPTWPSVHLSIPSGYADGHPGLARDVVALVHGDVMATPDLYQPKQVEHWYRMSEIDVLAEAGCFVVVLRSITDGRGLRRRE